MKRLETKILNYGGDDENGQFFQSLEIRLESGKIVYVLFHGRSEQEGFIYEKKEFQDKESLLKAGCGTFVKNWEKTDNDISYPT